MYSHFCACCTRFACGFAVLALIGCAQDPSTFTRPYLAAPTKPEPNATQSQTINLEAADRIARFRRIAAMIGRSPPEVEELYAPAGSVPGVDMPVPGTHPARAAFFGRGG